MRQHHLGGTRRVCGGPRDCHRVRAEHAANEGVREAHRRLRPTGSELLERTGDSGRRSRIRPASSTPMSQAIAKRLGI